MDRLLFSSLAAAKTQSTVRAQLTNDLANVSTPGFKKSFNHVLLRAVKVTADYGYQTRYQPTVASSNIVDLQAGRTNFTGRALDIAMEEKTVMGVVTEDGQTAFTRRGDIRLRADGTLVLGNNLVVAGEGGEPIVAPPETIITISREGIVNSTLPDQPEAPPVPVGQILLRDASEQVLARREDGLYEPKGANGGGGDFDNGPGLVSVQVGTLEGSNVSAIEAMVRLIDFSRSFESQINVIKESKDNDKTGATMMRTS